MAGRHTRSYQPAAAAPEPMRPPDVSPLPASWAVEDAMRILIATDGSKFSDAAAEAVGRQFRPQDAEVRVLSVVEPISEAVPPQMAQGYYPELQEQVRDAKKVTERTASMLTGAGFKVSTCVETGEAKTCILNEATKWRADLIVVGSHGRAGLERFLLGSVSEAVARHTTCSVEIVRLPKAA